MDKEFSVRLSAGATGPCANQWMSIHETNFGGNLESYKFAFSLVAMAFASDKKTRIHNYSSDDCEGATFVGIYKN